MGGEGDDRGWDIWMASPTQWTWFWVSSGNWWWTGRPGILQSMGLQRVRHDWATELYWPEVSKESTCQFKRHGFDSWVRKIPWRRKWQPAQNSCLENSMNSGAWWATVQEITPPQKKKREKYCLISFEEPDFFLFLPRICHNCYAHVYFQSSTVSLHFVAQREACPGASTATCSKGFQISIYFTLLVLGSP